MWYSIWISETIHSIWSEADEKATYSLCRSKDYEKPVTFVIFVLLVFIEEMQ
jgi:hypothetical protein